MIRLRLKILVVLLTLAAFECGLIPAIPDGGLMHPVPVFADQDDGGEDSGDADDGEDNRDGNAYDQEMTQLDAERDRELDSLEEEYDRELEQIEAEFQRDLDEEGDPVAAAEIYRDKRDQLEGKFEEQRRRLSKWYEEQAAAIEGQ